MSRSPSGLALLLLLSASFLGSGCRENQHHPFQDKGSIAGVLGEGKIGETVEETGEDQASDEALLELKEYQRRKPAKSSRRCSEDPILEWNEILLEANARDHALPQTDQGGPAHTARAFAIVSIAMFDAYNAIHPTATPYNFIRRVRHADAHTAVATAAYITLSHLYPQQKRFFIEKVLEDLGEDSFDEMSLQGMRVGALAALKILARRANDGSNKKEDYVFQVGPGKHQVDPLHPNQGVYGYGWGDVDYFAINGKPKYFAGPLPRLTSKQYAQSFAEVKRLGGDGVHTPTDRTLDQTHIGLFWAYDGTPGLGTPPRLYNQIVRVIAKNQSNSVAENARLFALVNIALADAGIVCWDDKYKYNFWRPVIGIREADQDGNSRTIADENWSPLGAPASNGAGTNFTPNFPSYTSGHATFGAAAFWAVKNFYGKERIPFSFTSDELNGKTIDQNGNVRPVVTRHYKTLSQAIEENGQSRIYLGIHWSFDKTRGINSGKEIADSVVRNVLRPLRK